MQPVQGPGPDRGVIFQEYGVFPWLTVRGNIEFGLRLAAARVSGAQRTEIVDRYMALMGLADFADHFPKHLSGGMRQRLALARAYAVKPEFLLMDEPFGALDAQTRTAMQDLLLQVLATEGKTVMLITHSVDEAIYLSSRIVVVTARPARVRTVIDVPFGYPRDEAVHEDPRFALLRAHIRTLVMKEYEAQARQAKRRRRLIRSTITTDHEETTMTLRRRTLLQAGAAASLGGIAAVAVAQPRTKLRVGYLHTPAVDGQIWLGQQSGVWTKRGLDLELIQFTTGLELFQAMIGGSLDVLSTGAVVSNFPARGQGKVFLLNNIEYATAQLWVRDDAIKSIADLKGKQISTTTGTTAHVFLDRALRAAKLDPAKDVQIVNQRMAEAVTSFVSGAVPAVALWVPFDSDGEAEGPERPQDRRRLGLLPRGRDHGRLGRAQRVLRRQQAGAHLADRRLGRGERRDARQLRRRRRDAAEDPVHERAARRLQGVDEVLEVLHLGRVEEALPGRHRHQVAAAGDRLLRRRRQHRQPGAGGAVLRSAAVPADREGLRPSKEWPESRGERPACP